MPSGDGTGPLGQGAGTGRGRGFCNRNRWLIGLAAPVVIAAVRDQLNPQGVLRNFASRLLSDKNNERHKIRRNAGYTVIDEKFGAEKIKP